jgi:hypothetical protein
MHRTLNSMICAALRELTIAFLSMLVPVVVSAETVDPDNDGSQHAWTGNTGFRSVSAR